MCIFKFNVRKSYKWVARSKGEKGQEERKCKAVGYHGCQEVKVLVLTLHCEGSCQTKFTLLLLKCIVANAFMFKYKWKYSNYSNNNKQVKKNIQIYI